MTVQTRIAAQTTRCTPTVAKMTIDSDWEDVTEDSGYRRFQFADPVAEMLDS